MISPCLNCKYIKENKKSFPACVECQKSGKPLAYARDIANKSTIPLNMIPREKQQRSEKDPV